MVRAVDKADAPVPKSHFQNEKLLGDEVKNFIPRPSTLTEIGPGPWSLVALVPATFNLALEKR